MTFRSHEVSYLAEAGLGRLATIRPDGTPQNSPVGYTYNAELQTVDISGYQMAKSQKYRNVATNPAVAFVVDDIVSRDPWRVRCLEIRGTAEHATQGDGRRGDAGDTLDSAIIRITPRRIISFGIDDTETEPHLLTPDTRNVASN